MADVYEIINIVDGSYLNVRSGPGTNYSVVGRLVNGDTAWVVSSQNGWLKLADKEWWISSTYAKLMKAESPQVNTPSAPSTSQTSALSSGSNQSYSANTVSGSDPYNVVGTNEAILAELKKYSRALGLPPRHTRVTDCRYMEDNYGFAFGRNYVNTILSSPTIVSMCPGYVHYLPNFSQQEQDSFFERVTSMAQGSPVGSLIDTDKKTLHGTASQLYQFTSKYTEYINTVNLLCRATAVFLGIGDRKYPGSQVSYKNFDWGNQVTPADARANANDTSIFAKITSAIQDSISDGTYIHLFVTGEGTNASESMSTSTRSSALEQLFESTLGSISKDIEFMLGSTLDNTDIDNDLNEIINQSTANGTMISNLLRTGKDYLSGAKMIFPKMLDGFEYGRTFSVNCKFMANSGDPENIFLDVYVPCMFLLAIMLPRQKGYNTYTYPFLVRIFCKGLYNCDLAAVTNLQISRGGSDDTCWTVDGLPTEVNVSFEVTPLYDKMMSSNAEHPLLFLSNTPLIEYLAAITGVDLKANNWDLQLDVAKMAIQNKFSLTNAITSAGRKIAYDSNFINAIRNIVNLP